MQFGKMFTLLVLYAAPAALASQACTDAPREKWLVEARVNPVDGTIGSRKDES